MKELLAKRLKLLSQALPSTASEIWGQAQYDEVIHTTGGDLYKWLVVGSKNLRDQVVGDFFILGHTTVYMVGALLILMSFSRSM